MEREAVLGGQGSAAVTGAISRSQMGALDKLGQGGQGIVYRAPGVRTPFSKSMVYKEYKKATLASLDVDALKAMPEFLESLPYGDGARLIELAAWPCRVVEDGGVITGFVMPAIPDEFFCDFWTSNATSPERVMAEFQHLLNDPQVVAARFGGVGISDRHRYELLSEVATAMEFLHERDVCIGDISPKNLLFSIAPEAAVYFVDCDAMRVRGVSLSRQVETPGWDVPAGEEKATVYSDRYKLGLLSLRLLAGDQAVRDPARLPANVPVRLRSVITETLINSPERRPDLSVWKAALDHAIPGASTQVTRSQPSHLPPVQPMPARPTVSTPTPGVFVPRQSRAPSSVAVGPPLKAGSKWTAWLVVPAVVVGGVLINSALNRDSTASTPTTTTVTATAMATPDSTITKTTTQTVAPPATKTAAAEPPAPSGDLGLSVPMSYPACDGTGIVVVGNAVTPGSYRQDVASLLNRNPGASYLRTDMSCKSLRQRSDQGTAIYAVYYVAGPYPEQVCALKSRVHDNGNAGAYGKWLSSGEDSESIEC